MAWLQAQGVSTRGQYNARYIAQSDAPPHTDAFRSKHGFMMAVRMNAYKIISKLILLTFFGKFVTKILKGEASRSF